MNLEEIFHIARVFSFKIKKYHNMKTAYARAYDFLKSPVCDFTTIDAEIHPSLSNKIGFLLINSPTIIVEDIQEMNCRATNYAELGIVFMPIKIFSRLVHFIDVLTSIWNKSFSPLID